MSDPVVANEPFTAVLAFNEANVLFKQGQWAEALARVDAALAQEATMELGWLLKARCLVHLNEWMPAREAFAQTLRLNVANYSAWLEAGHLCKQMGELQQAAMAYQRAIDVSPDRYEALLGMARVMVQQGHVQLAERAHLDAADKAQVHGPKRVHQVHHLMGQYWLESGRSAEAAPCLPWPCRCRACRWMPLPKCRWTWAWRCCDWVGTKSRCIA